MATPAQLLSDIATAVEAQVSGATRVVNDYRDDLETIAANATKYQLRGWSAREDSTRSYPVRKVLGVELTIHHRLNDPADVRAYTEGAMQTNIAALIAPTFWRGLTNAHEVIEEPECAAPEPEGNVISFTITLEVSVNP